jgi:hypothetical protein
MLYTAIAIGPNLTKSRLGGTVLAYILVYIATQIVATIQLVVLIVPIAAMDSSTFTVYGGSATALEFFVPSTVDQAALWIFGTFIVGYIVMSLAYYLITRHFMTRKLNLA